MDAGARRSEAERLAVLVRNLKRSGGAPAAAPRRLRWGDDVIGTIRPMGHAEAANDDLVARMCEWRNGHREAFFTQFEATLESTRNWLEQIVDDPGRAMFLVSDAAGRPVGHCGARDIRPDGAEIDAILRGERPGHALLMTLAVEAVIGWLFGDLRIDRSHARVFADNARSLRLFLSLGMRVVRWESFRPLTDGGVIRYGPADNPDHPDIRKVAHLELRHEDFRRIVASASSRQDTERLTATPPSEPDNRGLLP
jgi:RimJ/RimL family protein N-acetyltransferase